MAWFLSYTGERNGSNMVIVDVKMLSGFIPLKSSVRKVGGCLLHEQHPVSVFETLFKLL